MQGFSTVPSMIVPSVEEEVAVGAEDPGRAARRDVAALLALEAVATADPAVDVGEDAVGGDLRDVEGRVVGCRAPRVQLPIGIRAA